MKNPDPDKRDWSLLIFIVPVGIFLMMIAGQIAVRIVPNWSVDAGMQSSLKLEAAPKQQVDLIQPLLPEILTPLAWFDTFLTPNSNPGGIIVYPPFIVFQASATPSPTTLPVASPTVSGTPPTSVTPSATIETPAPPATRTQEPPGDDEGTPPPPPALCTDTSANNEGSPLPCTYTPVTSTPEGTLLTPTPAGINVGAPNGSPLGTIPDGRYVVINLSPSPIMVNGPSDTNYDFVYYEESSGPGILMDKVKLSISTNNIIYYMVFNWGDGTPDANSNIGDVAATTTTENDNQPINSSELYGTTPLKTGVLVDVDNAPSHPPVGSYQYLAIQAPPTPDSTDGIGMDSVQVIEVSPTP
jgi:hypothetical protein